jgi:hypothetical protein
VAGQIGLYLEKHLQNYRPDISIIPARKRGTEFSPDDPSLLTPLYASDFILVGPGSPSYAARQLRGSVAWQTLRACQRLGSGIIFASATTIASSRHALPVYEIYKVGEDLHWKPGLDFFADYGLNLVFVPHWNNNDGGAVLDTSHCYIGTSRYEEMIDLLPAADARDRTIVGIDENTALIVNPATGACDVRGMGGMLVIREGKTQNFTTGESFDVRMLGSFRLPQDGEGLEADVWQNVVDAVADAQAERSAAPVAPDAILALVERRETARANREWSTADQLREEIEAAGWQLMDTPEGPVLEAQQP